MKARYLAGAAVTIALVVIFCLLFARTPEPNYRNHSLSHWLAQLLFNPSDTEATEALRAIGTNAYPFLVERVRAEDSKLVRLARGELGLELVKHPGANQNQEAAIAFKILGPQFESWLPGLTRGLTNASGSTLVILGEIGEPGLPAVIACLTNSDTGVRRGAATSLMFFTCDTKSAEPALVKALGDSNKLVRSRAAMALARIKPHDTILTLFVQNLESTNRALVLASMLGLKHMGLSATGAIPALKLASDSADSEISTNAAKAIQGIQRGR